MGKKSRLIKEIEKARKDIKSVTKTDVKLQPDWCLVEAVLYESQARLVKEIEVLHEKIQSIQEELDDIDSALLEVSIAQEALNDE